MFNLYDLYDLYIYMICIWIPASKPGTSEFPSICPTTSSVAKKSPSNNPSRTFLQKGFGNCLLANAVTVPLGLTSGN